MAYLWLTFGMAYFIHNPWLSKPWLTLRYGSYIHRKHMLTHNFACSAYTTSHRHALPNLPRNQTMHLCLDEESYAACPTFLWNATPHFGLPMAWRKMKMKSNTDTVVDHAPSFDILPGLQTRLETNETLPLGGIY